MTVISDSTEYDLYIKITIGILVPFLLSLSAGIACAIITGASSDKETGNAMGKKVFWFVLVTLYGIGLVMLAVKYAESLRFW